MVVLPYTVQEGLVTSKRTCPAAAVIVKSPKAINAPEKLTLSLTETLILKSWKDCAALVIVIPPALTDLVIDTSDAPELNVHLEGIFQLPEQYHVEVLRLIVAA